jgi:hypothetical protein
VLHHSNGLRRNHTPRHNNTRRRSNVPNRRMSPNRRVSSAECLRRQRPTVSRGPLHILARPRSTTSQALRRAQRDCRSLMIGACRPSMSQRGKPRPKEDESSA